MFAGTSVIFFAVINITKLVPYFLLGQFSPANLQAAALLAPLSIVCALGAVWLVKVIDQALFYRAIYILMFLIGLYLIGQAGVDLI